MCSCCSCSFSPCRRLHVLKAGSNWTELVCGMVPVRLASHGPHPQPFSKCNGAFSYRLLCACLHSSRTPHRKGHEVQNGCTLSTAFATLQRQFLLITYYVPHPLCYYFLLFSFHIPLFLIHYCTFKLPKCNLAFKGKTASTLWTVLENITGYFWLQ